VTLCPLLLSWSAAAKPAGPLPMMATVLVVRTGGGRGAIQPISKALSIMVHSTLLIDTGSSMIPRTQAPSHGAGQTRPVNSGKLLVSSKRRRASCQLPCFASAFHSGIKLPRGQPLLSVTDWWQNGVPQSMHRPA